MKPVKIKFLNTEFDLGADDASRLTLLAQRYEQRAAEVTSGLGGHLSDLKAAIVTAIMMEDQIESLSHKADASNENYKADAENTRVEMENLRKNFSQTINQLCDYIDHLSEQITKRYG